MQSKEDVSRAEADPDFRRDAPRATERLPPAGADWSIDGDPVNPGWRSSRSGSARQRLAARRSPVASSFRLPPLGPWMRAGGWRWLALAAGLLLLLAVGLSLWGLGGAPSTAENQAPAAGAAGAATLRPTVTAAAPLPTAPPAPQAFTVANTAGQGLLLRPEPNTNLTPVKLLAEGTRLEALGEEVQGADYVWIKVRDPEGAEGWVARDFVAPAS